MAKYSVEYTLPGTMGKVVKRTFPSKEARDTHIAKIKKQGARIKATSSSG